MTEMDDYYMKRGKYAPKPEPEDDINQTYAYLFGCVIAVVFLGLVHHVVSHMNKINTLLKCLPKSPFTDQLTAEIRELTHQRNQYKADAKKYEWMVINHDKWSWHPSIYNKDIISGFSANGTGYLGYTFSTALKLAMKAKK